jgi:hypothetical protein
MNTAATGNSAAAPARASAEDDPIEFVEHIDGATGW